MKHRAALGACLAAALLACTATSADAELKSGPQVGSKRIKAFNPLHCNGSGSGTRDCLVWANGSNPVAVVFAREITDGLTSLVKRLDEAAVENKAAKMGSFVVFCADEEGLEKRLKALAERQGLKKVILTIDNPAGPDGWEIAKDADVTVVLYQRRTVKANHAFKKGELKGKAVDAVLADLPKILPEKK